MIGILRRTSLAAMLAGVLAGCQSTTLLDVDNEFFDLVHYKADIEKADEAGELDPPAIMAVQENLRTQFAANGDLAVAAADNAKTAGSRVSFLNAAIRNYILADAISSAKIPGLVARGVDACRSPDLADFNALPTTCGYFHLATGQAIANQSTREWEDLNKLVSKDSTLSAAESLRVLETFEGYILALDKLEKGGNEVAWQNVGPELESWFRRQQNLVFCNALRPRLLLAKTQETADGWNRDDVKRHMQDELQAWENKLSQRTVGFDRRVTCY